MSEHSVRQVAHPVLVPAPRALRMLGTRMFDVRRRASGPIKRRQPRAIRIRANEQPQGIAGLCLAQARFALTTWLPPFCAAAVNTWGYC